jgi:hypothetical protein
MRTYINKNIVKQLLPLLCITSLAGCKISTFYPMAGAVTGATVGAMGSPIMAGGGAMAGYSVGELAKNADQGGGGSSDMAAAIETVAALSQGDVEKILKLQMEKEGGFADKIMKETVGLLKLAVLGCALWIIIPMIYSRYIHKKERSHRDELHKEVAKVKEAVNGGGK